MTTEEELLNTTDAGMWAQAFMERFHDKIYATSLDEGTMIGWFANAIETTTRVRSTPHLIEQLQATVKQVNTANGWFDDSRTIGDDIALLHSEVSEAFEEFRDYGVGAYWRDDNDVAWSIDASEYGDKKPLGVPSEFADIFIRLLDSCERYGIDLLAETKAKLAYNATRGYKHGGKSV